MEFWLQNKQMEYPSILLKTTPRLGMVLIEVVWSLNAFEPAAGGNFGGFGYVLAAVISLKMYLDMLFSHKTTPKSDKKFRLGRTKIHELSVF